MTGIQEAALSDMYKKLNSRQDENVIDKMTKIPYAKTKNLDNDVLNAINDSKSRLTAGLREIWQA